MLKDDTAAANPLISKWADNVTWEDLESQLFHYLLSYAGRDTNKFDEYALIQWLDAKRVFDSLGIESVTLKLFVKHFTVRRCLYALRQKLFNTGFELKFDLMFITLQRRQMPRHQAVEISCPVVASDLLIAGFYGDLNTLLQANENSVNQLLGNFWASYTAYQQADSAYSVLGVSIETSWPKIQLAYRLLASRYHPDKGGDGDKFVAVKAAYDQIKVLRAAKKGET